ncbi:MAG: valine--tRNA ligase [Acidobacteriia bacterium]|nr:valine--tRNA ligase [Terriglobia bacterium]
MMKREIPKVYDPRSCEEKWYPFWESRGYFVADVHSAKPSYVMVFPPPNVTGTLHMGHMLVTTLHDIVARWRRMSGDNVLWLPGMDHAGIATQNVVERKLLQEEKKTRHDLGRAEFEKRVWQWKAESGGMILKQMRRLGASCDWTRERFTLDEGLSRAVRIAFVRLFEDGLIYRAKRLINWCPRCTTALSDLEVKYEERSAKLWTIRYPLKGVGGVVNSEEFVTIATTRPETMLGDTALAIHPSDERYFYLKGRHAILPLIERELPIVEDERVDPAFGTGIVKVTPAHDPNDFEIGLKNNLPQISILDEHAQIINAGLYNGLDRFAARKKILEDLRAAELLVDEKDHIHNIGKCDRCATVVEPLISTQWFMRMSDPDPAKNLAAPALKAVEDGYIKFIPPSKINIYREWMTHIQDWCISRQLWWGHRIPVWYCDACGEVFSAVDDPTACRKCHSTKLRQDADVLDTWFSSQLWPFSTLGWPEATEDLEKFYPTTTMITAADIIFFWVARMIMSGVRFRGHERWRLQNPPRQNYLEWTPEQWKQAVPFGTVYFNVLVRDAEGQKMSKSKNNVIDPLLVTDQYGTDAVRFTLAAMAAPGSDIALSKERMEGYRAFANKIWNAARFVFMNLPGENEKFDPARDLETAGSIFDRWIRSRCASMAEGVNRALQEFRFHEAAHLVYQFFWHELCDWYLELIKPILTDPTVPSEARLTQSRLLVSIFDYSLRVLHPFMPFITEELWQQLPGTEGTLCLAPFPSFMEERFSDPQAVEAVELLQGVVGGIRSLRAEHGIAPSHKIPVHVFLASVEQKDGLQQFESQVKILAGVDVLELSIGDVARVKGLKHIESDFAVMIPSAVVDHREKGIERLNREKEKLDKDLANVKHKLGDPKFVERAPETVVADWRSLEQELTRKRSRIVENIEAYLEN